MAELPANVAVRDIGTVWCKDHERREFIYLAAPHPALPDWGFVTENPHRESPVCPEPECRLAPGHEADLYHADGERTWFYVGEDRVEAAHGGRYRATGSNSWAGTKP